MRFTLEQSGYEIVEAENGDDGFKKVQNERFDLIITDIAMPGMDGYTFVKQLKNTRQADGVPIIVSSAHDRLQDVFEIDKEIKIQGFIVKPYPVEEVVEKVKKILG